MADQKSRLVYSIFSEDDRELCLTFPLHRHTGTPEHVGDLMDAILEALDCEVERLGATNGDVLQALSMALACRASLMDGAIETNTALADDLAQDALAAARASLAADRTGHTGGKL